MENVIVIALKAIIVHDNEILIIRRSKTDPMIPGIWEFAGGKLEFGENLEEGLKREILEETGLEVTIEKSLFATTFQTHEYRQVVIIIYLCFTDSKEIQLSFEHDDYKWVGKKELFKFITKRMANDLKSNHILDQLDIRED